MLGFLVSRGPAPAPLRRSALPRVRVVVLRCAPHGTYCRQSPRIARNHRPARRRRHGRGTTVSRSPVVSLQSTGDRGPQTGDHEPEMSLTPGTRLGAFEVVATLGAGGMGEVFRAQDTKLNRQVAIKVLPEAYASDPDRVARFHREAQAVAALNHPNIAAIYDLAESGDTKFLVLELIEGDTLADRMTHGAVSIDEALAIAKQIIEALEAAHEKGVCHRDLKPANVKLTADGQVKVLDFGLAKVMQSG